MPAEFEPTTDQRALVQNAAAFGINQADIANQLNIDEKTLRKHFRTTRKVAVKNSRRERRPSHRRLFQHHRPKAALRGSGAERLATGRLRRLTPLGTIRCSSVLDQGLYLCL